jgi:hypothetical protein
MTGLGNWDWGIGIEVIKLVRQTGRYFKKVIKLVRQGWDGLGDWGIVGL